MSSATLIPVASGKGGVGKTFLTAGLAVALAQKGFRTLAVDLDLGGSNLHSFLGFPNRHPGIGDFLKARVSDLPSLVVPTGVPNLSLLTGEGRTPFMANLPYAQKQRLIRELRSLTADYILMDLGAGTNLDTLDFFRMTPRGLAVTTPEFPSIMGMLGFLKHCCLRTVVRTAAGKPLLKEVIMDLFKRPMTGGRLTMRKILEETRRVDPEAAAVLQEALERFRPRVVFNMGRHPDELSLTRKIDESLRNVLSIEADHFGFVFEDPAVRRSVRQGTLFLPAHGDSPAGQGLIRVAERIARFWNLEIPDSAARIRGAVAAAFEEGTGAG